MTHIVNTNYFTLNYNNNNNNNNNINYYVF